MNDKTGFLAAFDLETIANPFLMDILPPPVENGTIKDPIKQQEWLDAKAEKNRQDMGKNPHLNMICCMNWQDVYSGDKGCMMLDPTTNNESELLEEIWDVLAGFELFTTFNGNIFDVECLKFHSLLNNVKTSQDISQHPYIISNHVDIRMVLGKGQKFARGTQDFFSRVILGEETQDAMGSQIQQMWDDGDYDGIALKCEDDVDKLVRIYKRMDGYYGF